MSNNILIVGSEKFIEILPDQIYHKTLFRVETVTNLEQAQAWIDLKPPDILLVQASFEGSIDLCRWLKQQQRLTCLYCILLEDRPQIINQKSQADPSWEFELTAMVLEESADAYIWILQDELSASHRLLMAQIQVGLRKANKYRELMQTNHVLSTLTLIDPLTQLNNRRALDSDLNRQIHSSRTLKIPLSLLMLDVDHFKVINDTYGHLVGDHILQLLSARLRHNLRFQDTSFRYGGEEFAILMPNTHCQKALLVARRLNHIVREQPFAIDKQVAINITLSIGVTSLQASDDANGISLLARADKYLLQAKAAGRNCAIGCADEVQ